MTGVQTCALPISGISITSGYDKRRDTHHFYARASWVDRKRKKKRPCGTGFSIAKHGLEMAVFLAIRARLIGIHGSRHINNLVGDSMPKEYKFNFAELQKVLAKRRLAVLRL